MSESDYRFASFRKKSDGDCWFVGQDEPQDVTLVGMVRVKAVRGCRTGVTPQGVHAQCPAS